MSRAFVKEQDGDVPEERLPDRQISDHPNYVTPSGLRQLEQRVGELEEQRLHLLAAAEDEGSLAAAQLAYVDRDLRYFTKRQETAIVVKPAGQPRRMVKFGAAVTVKEGGGATRVFRIVGEDEADPNNGLLSYVSPLAETLLDARVGATVRWRRPAGDRQLTIEAIDYPAE